MGNVSHIFYMPRPVKGVCHCAQGITYVGSIDMCRQGRSILLDGTCERRRKSIIEILNLKCQCK